jgi:hypothetical protein
MDTDNLSLSIVSPSLTFTLPERRLASAAAPSSPRRLHADAAFETLCSSLRCGTPLQLLTSPRRVRALPSTPAHEAEEVLYQGKSLHISSNIHISTAAAIGTHISGRPATTQRSTRSATRHCSATQMPQRAPLLLQHAPPVLQVASTPAARTLVALQPDLHTHAHPPDNFDQRCITPTRGIHSITPHSTSSPLSRLALARHSDGCRALPQPQPLTLVLLRLCFTCMCVSCLFQCTAPL